MEVEEQESIILHHIPLLAEQEAKALIIQSFPQLHLNSSDIQLLRSGDKYQAFLIVPATQLAEICDLKEIVFGKDKFFIRKGFTNFQVFVSKLPDGLTSEEVKATLEAEFGKVLKVEEVQPHVGAKNKFRHCYIRFQSEADAEKCLFSSKKIQIKDKQIKVARAYALGQNQETDKKLFLKVISPIDDVEELEKALNDHFRKQGKLREKIRYESGKGYVNFISSQVADRVIHSFKGGKISKYDVVLRPFASNKDNYTIFLGGLIPSITQSQLQAALSAYQPLLSAVVLPSNNLTIRNGSATFGSQQTFKNILANYIEDKKLKEIFIGVPYITVHMNAKDRLDYNSFKKGKIELPIAKKMQGNINGMTMQPPMMPPMGMMFPPNMVFGPGHIGPMGPMTRQMPPPQFN